MIFIHYSVQGRVWLSGLGMGCGFRQTLAILYLIAVMDEIRCPPRQPGAADGPSVPLYKVLIIGDSNVGKTSLLNRYCDDNFQGSLIATVGESTLSISYQSTMYW